LGLALFPPASLPFEKHIKALHSKSRSFFLVGKVRDFDVQGFLSGKIRVYVTQRDLEGCQRQISPPLQFFCSLALSIVMTQALCAWQGSNKNNLCLVTNQNRESLAKCQIQVFLTDSEWSSLLSLLIKGTCLEKPKHPFG
jgi:hypothetical protein